MVWGGQPGVIKPVEEFDVDVGDTASKGTVSPRGSFRPKHARHTLKMKLGIQAPYLMNQSKTVRALMTQKVPWEYLAAASKKAVTMAMSVLFVSNVWRTLDRISLGMSQNDSIVRQKMVILCVMSK